MSQHEALWEAVWGARYDYRTLKATAVQQALADIVLPGEAPVIVDYGCGAFPVSLQFEGAPKQTIFRAFVDIAAEDGYFPPNHEFFPASARTSSTSVLIRGDIDAMAASVPAGRTACRSLRAFLAGHNSAGKPEADMAIMSDILNYVDHNRALRFATKYLKTGGILFIVNEATRGFGEVFSPRGIRNDAALPALLQNQLGYEVCAETTGASTFSSHAGVTIISAVKTATK